MQLSFNTQVLLSKWKVCEKNRYPVLVVIPNERQKYIIDDIDKINKYVSGQILNFEDTYKGQLDKFQTRYFIRSKIIEKARESAVIVFNIEHHYDKWRIDERISFIRDLIRQDGHKGIILFIYCEEDLSTLKKITERNRGVIWNI